MKAKNNYKKEIILINKKLCRIENKHRNFDFTDLTIKKDLEKYWLLKNKIKQLIKNSKFCDSDNPDDMCENCDCWKHTRAMCS